MADIQGMNIDQVRQLASTFTQQSNNIQGVVTQISSVVSSLQWAGPNAKAFGAAWSGTHAVAMMKIVTMLLQQAQQLMQQLKQQEQASSVSGSSPTVNAPAVTTPPVSTFIKVT
ncbi:MAG: WXG100 family type VII secretion target [Propionibacteriaceae bacterium]|nr:WXG100 family type VII secretion target [Propionibacteriaceae bacterium]